MFIIFMASISVMWLWISVLDLVVWDEQLPMHRSSHFKTPNIKVIYNMALVLPQELLEWGWTFKIPTFGFAIQTRRQWVWIQIYLKRLRMYPTTAQTKKNRTNSGRLIHACVRHKYHSEEKEKKQSQRGLHFNGHPIGFES